MKSDSIWHMAFLFWIIIDGLGNIPIVVSILKPYDDKRQKKIIFRELLIALCVMILFLFGGERFFKLLKLNLSSLEIAGGIILFIIAINMIFSKHPKEKTGRAPKEPLIVPLAVPALAGPGILATISLYGGGIGANKWAVLVAIVIAWVFTFPFLYFSPYLKKWIGDNGLIAVERLFGYLIVLISCQMALHGLQDVIIKLS